MRSLTQLLLVVLMAYAANAFDRKDFMKRMMQRGNPMFTMNPISPAQPPALPTSPVQRPAMPTLPVQRPAMPTLPAQRVMPVRRPSNSRILSDDGSFDANLLESQRERDEAIREADRQRLAAEQEKRLEMETQRIKAEEERQAQDEENLEKFRQRQQEMEERLREQAAKLEEERLEREELVKQRQSERQERLENQRQALEEHRLQQEVHRKEQEEQRLQQEIHRKEMEKAQRQKDQETRNRFKENRLAQEEKLREQEQAQREFEESQRALEKEQREMNMAGLEEAKARIVIPLQEVNQSMCIKNPCMNNGVCTDVENNKFKCKCLAEFTGLKCETNMMKFLPKSAPLNICDENSCQNSGKCEPTKSGFKCICNKPFIGEVCDQIWVNPCTEENLRSIDISQFKNPWSESSYIICTDINVYHTMPCSIGTVFNEDFGHCVIRGYIPKICPHGHCKNDAECIMDENEEFKCICKLGFTGEFCETNINECEVSGGNEACANGKCIDQLNGFYCECSNGIGLNCEETIPNPCTKEVIESKREFFIVPCIEGRTYLHCTSENQFVVNKCVEGLFWDQQERACVLDRPLIKTGKCSEFPCENGDCEDIDGTQFRCVCKAGYEGNFCETMIDSCASNPCQNGGKCLPYAGGYTCACHDKVVDECCCHGIKNPCPSKSRIIPGVNNYFPHLFTNRYIHCDFEGRAFSRNCPESLKWHQSTLSCLPDDNVHLTTTVETPFEKNSEATHLMREAELKERHRKLIERAQILAQRHTKSK